MNKERRKSLEAAVKFIGVALEHYANGNEQLDQAIAYIQEVKDGEQEGHDNLPEGLQSGEKGQSMEENINLLQEAEDALTEFLDTGFEPIDSAHQTVVDVIG